MERMKKKKKEIRLRTFFVRFLLKLVAAVLLAFLLWLLQITVSVGTGLILPANAAEKEALAYLHTIGAHTDIVSSGIPSACGYAIYDASGELLETDMSGSIRENADLLALSGQDSLSANMLGRTYVKRQTDTRIVVLTYDFRSAFANPALRRLFPSAELLEVFLLLFLLLAAFVLVITRQAKYLSRELFHLQEAADEMAEANLHRCDSICLKVCMAALIGIGFACAIGRLVLTTEVIGYCLMGTLILIEVVRTVAFWLMDEKGL